jgi:hypothetical protein
MSFSTESQDEGEAIVDKVGPPLVLIRQC